MAKNYQESPQLYPSLTPNDTDIRDPNDINKHLRVKESNKLSSKLICVSLARFLQCYR